MMTSGNLILLAFAGLALAGAGYMYYTRKNDPTLEQWTNRFLEYWDQPYLDMAKDRFKALVSAGMNPEHAFKVVTSH
jgi:hypothetical protein